MIRTCAVCILLWVLYIVMSSAYVIMCTFSGGCGMSDVYMLKSVGDRTPPCGTPVCCILICDFVLLYVVYICLPFK